MTLWAILPVKPLRSGKSRLSKVLSEEERAALNQNLLQNSLKVLASLELIDTILVVSRDPAVLTIARDYGAKTVLENGNPYYFSPNRFELLNGKAPVNIIEETEKDKKKHVKSPTDFLKDMKNKKITPLKDDDDDDNFYGNRRSC